MLKKFLAQLAVIFLSLEKFAQLAILADQKVNSRALLFFSPTQLVILILSFWFLSLRQVVLAQLAILTNQQVYSSAQFSLITAQLVIYLFSARLLFCSARHLKPSASFQSRIALFLRS